MKKILILSVVTFFSLNISAQQAAEKNVEKKILQVSVVPPLSVGKPSDPFIYHGSLSLLAGYNYGIEGLEIGGFLNITQTDAKYSQISGMANWVNQDFTGLQLAGAFNRADQVKGTQISGAINSAKKVSGAQIAGAINQAEEVKGLQLSGAVNIAKSVKGLQLGVINIADTIESGVSIGIISIVKTGIHHFELSSNDITPVQLAFRSGGETLYGIFLTGIQTQNDPLWTSGLGFGTRFRPLKNKDFFSTVELTGSALAETSGSVGGDLNILNRFSLNAGYQFGKRLSVIAGPALNIYVTDMHDAETGKFGYDIGRNNLFSRSSEKTNIRMWLGYQVGLWF